jgi:hypothetical protein
MDANLCHGGSTAFLPVTVDIKKQNYFSLDDARELATLSPTLLLKV